METSEERIMTLHPRGKAGVHILKRRYDMIKAYLLKKIKEHNTISYSELNDMAEADLTSSFDGKIPWYVVTVKLDLEARNIIERVPKSSPHKVRMATT